MSAAGSLSLAAERPFLRLLNVPVDLHRLDDVVARVLRALAGEGQCVFACVNPHSVIQAQADPVFRDALEGADLRAADGVGVCLAARLLRMPRTPRITGYDFFMVTLQALQARGGGRVFFFGSSEETLARIRARMRRDFPALEVVGAISPPFGEWSAAEDRAMVARINRARPDVLWVGMTAPKQEKWVARHRDELAVAVIGSIGAVFDFYAGTRPRAPAWLCRMGFEWLHRLASEPRRLWRRTFVSAPTFIALVVWRHLLRPAPGRLQGQRQSQ